MAENAIKVVSGYQPPWNNLLAVGPQAIREHLITHHAWLAVDVAKLSDADCWEAHDRCHEAALGGTLIGG